jgi:hypothetical protein
MNLVKFSAENKIQHGLMTDKGIVAVQGLTLTDIHAGFDKIINDNAMRDISYHVSPTH